MKSPSIKSLRACASPTSRGSNHAAPISAPVRPTRVKRKAIFAFVEATLKSEAATILSFYMGKNTPERKDYIMSNLVVPVED